MKKVKWLGLAAVIMALAIGTAVTYAWFTSTSGPTNLTVNTSKIAIADATMEENLDNRLPGETFGFEDWTFDNESTRETVVEFSISVEDIFYAEDENGVSDSYVDPRRAQLMALLNNPANVVITGITAGKDTNTVFTDPDTGFMYIWLEAGQQLDSAAFSISLKVPEELGGNYLGSDDRQDEHGTIITLACKAYAVQGTQAAVEDIFGTTIAGKFIDDYK